MQLRFSEGQEAFRAEVRAWLVDHTPDLDDRATGQDLVDRQRAWQAELAESGYVAVHWPVEHGGRALGWTESYLVQEELARARAPEIVNRVGVNLVGPTLLTHGTAAQRDRHLARIVTADDLWCQLFSEPDAGSDLAAMQTRAERVDGGWRVSGTKVWASNAQYCRFGVLLARTGAAERGRPPIGYFLLTMDQPGVEVRPLRQMTGESEFNEVRLDDAFVADDSVVGDPGDGWTVMRSTLGYERSTSPRQLIVHTILLETLLDQVRIGGGPATVRQELARAHAELTIYRLHLYRTLSRLDAGLAPDASSSVIKLFWSEMAQRMHETSLRLLGPAGQAAIADLPRRTRDQLYYRAGTIFAGTSEIQRNTLAEQVLGLPREPRPGRTP